MSFTSLKSYSTQDNPSGLSPIQAYLRVLDFSIQAFPHFAHTQTSKEFILRGFFFLLASQLQGISSCTAGMSKRVADNLVTSLVIPTSGGKKKRKRKDSCLKVLLNVHVLQILTQGPVVTSA